MIPVGRLAPGDQWDQHMLDLLFSNQLWPTGLEFERFGNYPNTDGCALMVPGRYWAGHEDEISEAVAAYRWLLFIRTSDEEDVFDIGLIDHPNARFWVQTPRTDRNYGDARLFGVGFPAHFDQLPAQPPDKSGAFLSAQNNHPRRRECFAALADREWAAPTTGFTRGVAPNKYAAMMAAARVAPAPAGPKTPDTFRMYEALEAHTVPIADDITTKYPSHGYWQMLFPGAPFPILTDYASLPDYIDTVLADWPANANRVTAWWIRQKRAMAHWLIEDLEKLGAL